jgi:hypothetical protein
MRLASSGRCAPARLLLMVDVGHVLAADKTAGPPPDEGRLPGVSERLRDFPVRGRSITGSGSLRRLL